MTTPSWAGLSLAEREREYSPSSMIGGDLTAIISEYRARSASCKQAYPPVQCDYGPGPDEQLDLYHPAGEARGGALHVFLHGGYWQELSRAESSFMALPLLARGCSVAVVDYTLAPRASLETIVDQCVRAVAWCAEHGHARSAGQTRLILSGSSAGAHLAAMVMTRVNVVDAAVLLSGVFDLAPLIGTYINEAVGITPDQAARLSPIGLVPLRPVPVIVADGAIETNEFHAQSDGMAKVWAAHGCPVTRLTIAGRHHFDLPFDLGEVSTILGRAVLELAETSLSRATP